MNDPSLDSLILEAFADVSVDKRLSRKIGGTDRPVPDFVTDWLVSRYTVDGVLDETRVSQFLFHHLPDKKHKEHLLYELKNGGQLKILDAYKVRVDIERDRVILEIPCLDITNAAIGTQIVDEHPLLLYGNVWGSGTISRRQRLDEQGEHYEICMTEFKPMQTSKVDLDYYIRARSRFTLRQWRELLVRSMGYNPEIYSPEAQLHLLTRLCPMVQPRVNLIELAPKGTGKSYIYSRLSRYAWLISGGVVTRAKLFYDMRTKSSGVITRFDAIVLDEVQTIKLGDENEIIGALKGYLEQGEFRVMQHKGSSDASFVILANIPIQNAKPRDSELFSDNLPSWLHGINATALLDRFHGLLPGWELPRISKESLCDGLALKADYLGEILHDLRSRTEYLQWVRDHSRSSGDIRDIVSVERIATAFLKLLFPNLECVDIRAFEESCLAPARELRQRIRDQLALMDAEYKSELAEIAAHAE